MPRLFWMREDGENQELVAPLEGARIVETKSLCSACGDKLTIRGENCRISADDRAYESEAFCDACNQPIGMLRFEMDTVFGITEDNSVLRHGRARVYRS